MKKTWKNRRDHNHEFVCECCSAPPWKICRIIIAVFALVVVAVVAAFIGMHAACGDSGTPIPPSPPSMAAQSPPPPFPPFAPRLGVPPFCYCEHDWRFDYVVETSPFGPYMFGCSLNPAIIWLAGVPLGVLLFFCTCYGVISYRNRDTVTDCFQLVKRNPNYVQYPVFFDLFGGNAGKKGRSAAAKSGVAASVTLEIP